MSTKLAVQIVRTIEVDPEQLIAKSESPDVTAMEEALNDVLELALKPARSEHAALLERLGATVSEEEWLWLCKYQIAVDTAIGAAWRIGLVCWLAVNG